MSGPRKPNRDQRIAALLARHNGLMLEFIALGYTKTAASKAAFDVVTRRMSRDEAEAALARSE